MKKSRHIIFAGLFCAIISACAGTEIQMEATEPDSDGMASDDSPVAVPVAQIPDIRPGERPGPDGDEAGLWMLMRSVEQDLKAAPNLVRDPALNRYVRRIVCKLAGPRCKDIRPYILRRAAFNATMGPNGVLVIWSGALVRFRNEAQLAAVLGHEIGHYIRRHSLQRLRDVSGKTGFLNAVSIGTLIAGVPLAGDVAYLAVLGAVFSFSRENEREADGSGIRLMAAAGYDPREAAAVWGQLIAEQKAGKDSGRSATFFSTHPQAAERMETLAREGAALATSSKAKRKGSSAYGRILTPHYPAFLRDELHRRRFRRIAVLLDRMAQDGIAPGLVDYFRGEAARLEGKDYSKAIAAYRRAIAAGGAPPGLYRSLGMAYRRLGKPAEARAAFTRYLAKEAGAPDRALVRALMKESR